MRHDGGMPRYIALLRGINVGGANRVPMADLRTVVESLGHRDVVTYIQSGNVVFAAPRAATAKLAAALEAGIDGQLGIRCTVVVLTRAELEQVAADNPFPDEPNPKFVHAVFRQDPLTADDRAHVREAGERAAAKGSPDTVQIVGRTVFLHTPKGLGRSALAVELGRRKGPDETTTRNWATVTKLLSLLAD